MNGDISPRAPPFYIAPPSPQLQDSVHRSLLSGTGWLTARLSSEKKEIFNLVLEISVETKYSN